MRLLSFLIVLVSLPSAYAQNVTCTPDVPPETCKMVSDLFFVFTRQTEAQVILLTPAAFKEKQKSLGKEFERRFVVGLNPNAMRARAYSEDVLFERSDNPCPTLIYVSTDVFRPAVWITKTPATGEPEIVGAERGEGFDIDNAASLASYLRGFIDGCKEGVRLFIIDQQWKMKGP